VGDDPYGRSRLENLRFMYAGWKDSVARMASYVAKNAGIVPQVHYPEGRNPDRNGTYKDNSEHALDVLAGIGRGQGVAIPLIPPPWADDLMQSGKFTGDAASLCAWRISFAESRSGAGSEILEDIKHKEALIARGFLWPERSFTEGTTGTKAEAAVHGDIGLESCEDLNGDIAEFVNQQIVDELLVLNFGPEAKGSVRVVPRPAVRRRQGVLPRDHVAGARRAGQRGPADDADRSGPADGPGRDPQGAGSGGRQPADATTQRPERFAHGGRRRAGKRRRQQPIG